MFIAALSITAKAWKQPRCPSVDEWINKSHYIHAMEYYSVIKRNELSGYEKTGRNLKYVSLSQRSQSQKAMYDSSYMTFWKKHERNELLIHTTACMNLNSMYESQQHYAK